MSSSSPIVGGAVHGHDLPLGQEVIHDGEDGFLDFAGVARAADEDELLAEVEHDEGGGVGAVDFRDGVEVGGMDDGEFGHAAPGVRGPVRG